MSSDAVLDFAELINRAGRGEATAIEALVRQYEPKVRIVARVLLGPALRPYLDSVDLAQSVHKSIVTGLRDNKFVAHSPDDLVGLAVTILRRKAAKHWRHLQRQRRLSGDGTARGRDELPGVLSTLSGGGTDPADDAQYRDQLDHLCNQLDDAERTILDLRLEGYGPSEIADKIGISRVALRVRLTRLRQRLQAAGVITDWL
ncbi:RNA polymerase sigma factor [Limnoglobus roseus]|uniref:Sigma-70 family RNA polymerase sigma factor n=1 Tax=Limnoglobus roseus TaxID=2598579 RepID=A0A5C1ACC5_9BACT|nr:sigma-70 family RNA polymerase sigma factor [Limnoglobus roseus]QEL16255.1 sigma-70 family RNA polymerase sigma factor [Limnoglobus roseus]